MACHGNSYLSLDGAIKQAQIGIESYLEQEASANSYVEVCDDDDVDDC